MSRLETLATYVAASVLLPTVALSLRLIGLKRTCHLFSVPLIRAQQADSLGKEQQKDAEQRFLIVHRVSRRIPLSLQCLPRSIVLCSLLSWAKIDAVVRISVKREAQDLEAHAWVECSNAVLGEAPPEKQGLHVFS